MTILGVENKPETIINSDWPEDVWRITSEGITRWYYETRSFASLEALQISIRTNTELLAKRGDLILNIIRKYTPLTEQSVERMLDVGCGFGTIGLYVFEQLKAQEMLGIDMDPICIDTCRQLQEQLAWPGVQYAIDSMVAFKAPKTSYQLILSNNSFCYLRNTQDIQQAIRNFYQALAPSGAMVIYAPNRWHLKEAYTKMSGVQFLPATLADAYTRFRGYPEPYSTVRLLSPWELTRWFKAAGFSQTKLISPYRGTSDTGLQRFFKPYYAFVAIK